MKALARALLRKSFLPLLRVRASYCAHSLDALQRGPAIVCANHVSLLDGFIVALASPVPLTFGVDTDYSRRSKVAMRGMAALAWLGFGAVVPVDIDSPYGIRTMLKRLKAGDTLMLFPEGCISQDGTPQPEHQGIHWLQQRAGVKLIRVQITGAENSRFFAKSGTAFWPSINLAFGDAKQSNER